MAATSRATCRLAACPSATEGGVTGRREHRRFVSCSSRFGELTGVPRRPRASYVLHLHAPHGGLSTPYVAGSSGAVSTSAPHVSCPAVDRRERRVALSGDAWTPRAGRDTPRRPPTFGTLSHRPIVGRVYLFYPKCTFVVCATVCYCVPPAEPAFDFVCVLKARTRAAIKLQRASLTPHAPRAPQTRAQHGHICAAPKMSMPLARHHPPALQPRAHTGPALEVTKSRPRPPMCHVRLDDAKEFMPARASRAHSSLASTRPDRPHRSVPNSPSRRSMAASHALGRDFSRCSRTEVRLGLC